MTNEEVIRMLTRLKDQINFEWTDAQKKMDALNVAIEALSAEVRTQMSSADCISRQDAIMHFVKASKNYECGMFSLAEVTHELWEMPSAQRKAEWMHYGTKWEYRFTCSMCNYHLTGHKTNFCPNCGARMEAQR